MGAWPSHESAGKIIYSRRWATRTLKWAFSEAGVSFWFGTVHEQALAGAQHEEAWQARALAILSAKLGDRLALLTARKVWDEARVFGN